MLFLLLKIRSPSLSKTIITVGSVTYALKLRKLLSRKGIFSRLVKIDNTKENMGCTHGVEINNKDFLEAVIILKMNNLEYQVHQKD